MLPDNDVHTPLQDYAPDDAESHWLEVNGERLHVYRLGAPEAPPVVMLHGMQDVSGSLLPVGRAIARHYCVWLPDLRGHGSSVRPGTYAMAAFVYDLHRLVTGLAGAPVRLLGHSLGGQICARYAALFPQQVAAAVIAEGLGPPRRTTDDRACGPDAMAMEAARLEGVFSTKPRALPDVDFAAARLTANNPRLVPQRAAQIAQLATARDSRGELHWRFDPRVRSVFIGVEDAARYWPHVHCPVLLIHGRHAGEYWTKATGGRQPGDGDFAADELQQRRRMFGNATLVEFDGSGHMVHFDEPVRLAETALEFFRVGVLHGEALKRPPYEPVGPGRP